MSVRWWARGGGVRRMGPFGSQEEASRALLSPDGGHIEGAFVWPEGSEPPDVDAVDSERVGAMGKHLDALVAREVEAAVERCALIVELTPDAPAGLAKRIREQGGRKLVLAPGEKRKETPSED